MAILCVVSPAAPTVVGDREARMRRVIGVDIHRTFGEVVILEDGALPRVGRVDSTARLPEARSTTAPSNGC